MRWDTPRQQWHELTRVGTDALAVFGWLHWCGVEISGLVVSASPDIVGRELAMPRRRAQLALARLAKTDDPAAPALGDMDPVLIYDSDHHIGYLVGWNVPGAPNAPRSGDVVSARVRFAQRQPQCAPVQACLAELAQHTARWTLDFPEAPLVELYRELFRGKAVMPTADDLRDGSPLRRSLSAAWAKADRYPLMRVWDMDQWRGHFRSVADEVLQGGMYHVRSTTMKVTLDWLVLDTTIAAARGKRPDERRMHSV